MEIREDLGELRCPLFEDEHAPCEHCKNSPNEIPNEEPSKDQEPNSDKLCERCNKQERYWTVFWYSVNFTKEIHYFGENCPCLEQWKKEKEQTCPQCHKTESPDMGKGWMIDYEIKKVFCSSLCHVTYRQLKWEEAQKLKQIELITPPLAIPYNSRNNQPNFNREQESLRRLVLFWRNYAKELEKKLANQNNLSPQERQQANYLWRLQQNTLNSAEKSYKDKYGELKESNPKSEESKETDWTPLIIGGCVIGGILTVGAIIFLLVRSKKGLKK